MSSLILLAGMPGCGKSTYAETFFRGKYVIVSSDEIRKTLAGSLSDAHGKDIRPWDVFYQQLAECLEQDVDAVADATFLTRKHRLRAREVADRAVAQLHLVIFKNWPAAEVRNAHRAEDERVPPHVMRDMSDLYFDTLSEITAESYDTVTRIEAFN